MAVRIMHPPQTLTQNLWTRGAASQMQVCQLAHASCDLCVNCVRRLYNGTSVRDVYFRTLVPVHTYAEIQVADPWDSTSSWTHHL